MQTEDLEKLLLVLDCFIFGYLFEKYMKNFIDVDSSYQIGLIVRAN